MKELLERYDWNLFFAHFPNLEGGQVYRIYKSHASTQHELIGCGKTGDEAIAAALGHIPSATATPNPPPTGEPNVS